MDDTKETGAHTIMTNKFIQNSLDKYSESVDKRYHMPGHKGIISWPPIKNALKYDVTEVEGTDNLMHPSGPIESFMTKMNAFYETRKTYISVNGSTGGLMAAIAAVCKRGDKVLVQRDAHRSVYNAMALLNIDCSYLYPQINPKWGVAMAIDTREISSAIKVESDFKALILTHPNYYGFGCDLDEIVEIAHKANICVIVDEAHGAHLPFYEQANIKSALASKADIVVQSYHKTLPALTQTALVHLNTDRVDMKVLEKKLFTFQTTSPSYLFMNSMEYAFDYMVDKGRESLEELESEIQELTDNLSKIGGCEVYNIEKHNKNIENTKDFTKVLISAEGYSGYELEALLREKYRIQVEMADFKSVVLIITIADTRDDLKKLAKVMKEICQNQMDSDKEILNLVGDRYSSLERKLGLEEAFNLESKTVRLKNAIGEISADFIIPYPPGTPLIVPGELIDSKVVSTIEELIDLGQYILGIEDGFIEIIKGRI